MSDARNSSNSLRGGGKQSTGGKTRTSKKASSLPGSSAATVDDAVRQKQVEHAKEQMEGKELARGVLRETVGKVDYKGVGMELPNGVMGCRRLKKEERRELFYPTREEFIKVMEREWIDDVVHEFETIKGVRSIEGEGGDPKAYRKERLDGRKAIKDKVKEEEEGKGRVRLEDGRSVEEAERDKREAEEREKKTAEDAGLGNIPPEVLEAMRFKREAEDQAREIFDIAKDATEAGICVKCESDDKKLTMCGKCKVVGYCGRECQVGDWKGHKKGCKLFCAKRDAK